MKKITFMIFTITLALAGCGQEFERIVPQTQALKAGLTCPQLDDYLEKNFPDPQEGADLESIPIVESAEDPDTAEESDELASEDTAVEEADIIKTDGQSLYIVNRSGLLAYSVANPSQASRLYHIPLQGRPIELYAWQDRVYILTESDGVDLITFESSTGRLIQQHHFKGWYQDSRRVKSGLHLILQKMVSYTAEAQDLVNVNTRCQDVFVPKSLDDTYANVIEIISIDLSSATQGVRAVSVLSNRTPVLHASTESLYLADWDRQTDQTSVHKFRLSESGFPAEYVASHQLGGTVVDQFSMDEKDGILRIALTTNRQTFGADDNRNSVYTIVERGGGLEILGKLSNISPGESIMSARFVGDKGYLVTFVTKDPLFTLDLKDPSQPQMIGELEVPGFSTYIEPWGDFLITIGEDSENWWSMGKLTLSLFDVRDFAHPNLVDRYLFEERTFSEARWTHKAFNFFPERGILTIPISSAESQKLQVFSIDPQSGIRLLAEIDHDDLSEEREVDCWMPSMRRGLEVNGALVSLSDIGLKVHSFEDLQNPLFADHFPLEDGAYTSGCWIEDAIY